MVEHSTVRKLLDTIEMRLGRLLQFSNVSMDMYAHDVAVQVHQALGRLGDIQEYVRKILPYLESKGVL